MAELSQEERIAQMVVKDVDVLVKQYNERSDESTTELKEQIKNASQKYNDLQAQVDAMQRGVVPTEKKSREALLKGLKTVNEAFNNPMINQHTVQTVEIQSKAAVLESVNMDNTDGRVIRPDRRPDIIANPLRPKHIRDVLSIVTTSTDGYEYVHEKTYTDNTAIVAETVAALDSEVELKTERTPLFDVSANMTVSLNLLHDLPAFQQFITTRMVAKYYNAEDSFLMLGTGAGGTSIKGFKASATAFSPPTGSTGVVAPNRADLIRAMALQVRFQEFVADTVFMSPDTYYQLMVAKDSQNRYLRLLEELKDFRIVENTYVPTGELYVADTTQGCSIVEQSGLMLRSSFETGENFKKRQVTFQLDKRLGFVQFFSNCSIKCTDIATALTSIGPA